MSFAHASHSTIVYHLDILILIIILVFSLLNAPRALLYIANHRSEAFWGYLLRSSTQLRTYQSSGKRQGGSQALALPTLESAAALKQHWHFPMHFSLRHPAASFTQFRVFENYTVVQVLLMAGYTAAVLFVAFYKSNPFSIPKRSGWVIASQIPFVYALATKNNIIGLLVGVGYEKLNYLHRYVGQVMVVGANVHAIGYSRSSAFIFTVYKWTLAGHFLQKITQPYICWGIVALVCFDLLGFLSLQYVRMKFYNLFLGTHIVASVVALVAACNHRPACVPYVIAGASAYGLDHIVRAIRTHFTTATLQTIPELGLTRLHVPSLNTGWRPGQHVRLRILSISMGFWGMIEVHPFTIASATNTEEGLVLMCKKTGDWTQKLYEIAQTPERRVRVMVEGPYGGLGDTTLSNYSGAMFVAGGIGVTFALSAVQDLVLAGADSRTQVVDVIWCVRDPAALESFIPLFAALASQKGPAILRISVFYTRVASRPLEGLLLPPGVTLTAGRPHFKKLLSELVMSMVNEGGAHGAFVGVCGPTALSKDVVHAVTALDAASKRAIGGIELHEEVFAS